MISFSDVVFVSGIFFFDLELVVVRGVGDFFVNIMGISNFLGWSFIFVSLCFCFF